MEELTKFVTAIAALIGAVTGAIALKRLRDTKNNLEENTAKLDENTVLTQNIQKQTDGIVSRLVNATADAAKSEGLAEGKAQGASEEAARQSEKYQ